jgi:hypothetical protein
MAFSAEGGKTHPPFPLLIRSAAGVLVVLAFAVVAYILALGIESFPMPGQLGPAFGPKLLIILLIVSCLVKLGEVTAEWKKGETQDLTCAGKVNGARLTAIILVMLLSILAIEYIGFLLSNLLFIIAFLSLAGVRKALSLVLTSVLGTVGLLYLFVKVVYLPLPKGAWFFDDLTVFIYRVLHII